VVTDAAGAAIEGARLFLGDHTREVEGELLLRAVPPGPLHVFVGAEGCQTAIADVTVPATGRAELRVALPRW
jgi:hypothetical protein